jgi:hypothetical protein
MYSTAGGFKSHHRLSQGLATVAVAGQVALIRSRQYLEVRLPVPKNLIFQPGNLSSAHGELFVRLADSAAGRSRFICDAAPAQALKSELWPT